jgi:hypothetical protein
MRFLLTPGQAHDLAGADALLPYMTANLRSEIAPSMPIAEYSTR